jgi:predicted DsbA family dithiol-disulfide isomerase
MLGRKYGGGESNGKQMIDRVEATAAEEGLLFRHHDSIHANTRDAHRVLHLAEAEGKQLELKEALLDAYFVKGANVARHETLRELAATAGLDEERVREVLESREYDADVDRDIAEAGALGATGVPFFVIDRKYGVAGAQPTEVFTQILDRAWTESHPKLDLVGGDDVCGPDGCAI